MRYGLKGKIKNNAGISETKFYSGHVISYKFDLEKKMKVKEHVIQKDKPIFTSDINFAYIFTSEENAIKFSLEFKLPKSFKPVEIPITKK